MKSENGGAGHVIGAMLERFREKEPPVPGENEYIGENGLIFCSVCRTPKQCRVNMLGQPAVVPCICQCEKERLEKEKKRQEAEELQRRVLTVTNEWKRRNNKKKNSAEGRERATVHSVLECEVHSVK